MRDRHGLDVRVPDEEGRRIVHDIIYDELCVGRVREASRSAYRSVVTAERERLDIDAILLGCTEVGLLIDQGDTDLPVIDSTEVHVRAAPD